MRTKDRLLIAFRNLWRRKSRTILTILSVVIGTTSIIMMLSLGLGMQEQQKQMLESFGGLDTIEIVNQNQEGSSLKIDESTVNKLKKIEGVRVVIRHKDFYPEIRVKGQNDYSIPIYQGVRVIDDDVFKSLSKEDFEWGENIKASEDNVIILGFQLGVEEEVKLDKESYTAETVEDFDIENSSFILRLGYQDQENSPNFGENEGQETSSKPTSVDIPIKIKAKLKQNSFLQASLAYTNESTYRNLEKEDSKLESSVLTYSEDSSLSQNNNKNSLYDGISVVCNDYASVESVEDKLQELGYQTESNMSTIDEINRSSSIIMMILGAIGSIAFIVSAIGIINTMLMSIYERQKEIGVLKVIGASVSYIRSLFLIESGFIGLIGGVVGILISILLSKALNSVISSVVEDGLAFRIPIWLIISALTFSSLVGVLAGYLPAKRATKLSAIETLRSN